mmetsp:Transcript_52915/g.105027  ORF Transcript_52915/g.105027 Transcript_52915/m.105027 type:complete len:384 (-) Transcript_52915:260-1411(-)
MNMGKRVLLCAALIVIGGGYSEALQESQPSHTDLNSDSTQSELSQFKEDLKVAKANNFNAEQQLSVLKDLIEELKGELEIARADVFTVQSTEIDSCKRRREAAEIMADISDLSVYKAREAISATKAASEPHVAALKLTVARSTKACIMEVDKFEKKALKAMSYYAPIVHDVVFPELSHLVGLSCVQLFTLGKKILEGGKAAFVRTKINLSRLLDAHLKPLFTPFYNKNIEPTVKEMIIPFWKFNMEPHVIKIKISAVSALEAANSTAHQFATIARAKRPLVEINISKVYALVCAVLVKAYGATMDALKVPFGSAAERALNWTIVTLGSLLFQACTVFLLRLVIWLMAAKFRLLTSLLFFPASIVHRPFRFLFVKTTKGKQKRA